MKATTLFLVLLSATLQAAFGSPMHPKTLAERHSIVKRLAKADRIFTQHDVALVLHEKEPNSFHRISKRDLRNVAGDENIQRVRLELSSGSKMHLRLQKRSIVHPDTLFVDNTHNGLVKRATPPEDCYVTGDLESDVFSDGFVALATCDGLHGTAVSNGIEYYIHPVDHIDGAHQVHVLSRRAAENNTLPDTVSFDSVSSSGNALYRLKRSSTVTAETYKTATSFVIEMAVFVDANYLKRLQEIAPGREDEYNLIAMAATNALFSNKDKVGYEASIKIKLYQNWYVDPEEYVFEQSIFPNLKSFCEYTTVLYDYDMHFLFTGVTQQNGPAVGVAYMSGVCTKNRCLNAYAVTTTRYSLIAHEIGHNLGFNHHYAAKCPTEIKDQGPGFMGTTRDFSACNKWELYDFFSRGKGQCLFEETREVTTSNEFVDLAKVLPGQYYNPDDLCKLIAANDDYELFRPFDFRSNGQCAAWMCINRNKDSPEYLRIVRKYALGGYTCDDEMFCDRTTCTTWDKPGIGWDPSWFRANKQENHWSEWSDEWSPCSHSCGKGVQLKRRRCIFSDGPFLSPFCKGSPVRARMCNENPCPGEVISIDAQRKASGDEICQRFVDNNVSLAVKEGATYLNESKPASVRDTAAKFLETKKCLLMCTREPQSFNYLDSIYPNGSPCTESNKKYNKRKRFNIELRCVEGACLELSDCPHQEQKDACGVCGGDPVRCVDIVVDKYYDVPEGERSDIAVLPAGTSSIDVNMKYWENKYVRLELWTAKGEIIFGETGLYNKLRYKSPNFVSFANTSWTFDRYAFVQADGPTDQDLVIKALRKANPIAKIYVTYLLPETK